STNLLVVPAALPARSVKELVAMAKAKPGSLNYSSAGVGTTQHLAGELFKLRTGTQIVHVPYKGSSPSMTALLAGDVQLSFINPVAAGPHIKGGKLRALAVAGAKRTALFPDVPTMKEAGFPGVEVALWYGLLAPKQTPRDIVQKLAAAVEKASHDPDILKRLAADGAEPVGNSPEEFDRQLREDIAKYGEVVRVSGAKAN
ncbi:MAG TPA: tripartite tricarboxylate transporter substrate-binding protein, partial [Burkholderiales bacterium]|nr:tripartite tricarboxylate transporter substrate-binding protein [Burkholderiales bacterium]